MLVVQETTSWSTGTPNHIYFLSNNKTKMYAYINALTGEGKIFKVPMEFSAKGRTFDIIRKVDDQAKGIAVTGSKGDVYYVTQESGQYKCTCTGYKYHGTCKHIEKVINENTMDSVTVS